jgi:hypothetical protein
MLARLLQLQLDESEHRRSNCEAAWAERHEYAFAWSALAAAGVMSVIHQQQQDIDHLEKARAAAVAAAAAAASAASAPAPADGAARDHEVYVANRKLIATDLIRELVEANATARSELQQVIETLVEMQQRRQPPAGGGRRR